jgi:hypothetical protein
MTWGPQRDTTTHYVNVGPDGTYPGLRAQTERTRECRRSECTGIDTVHPDQLRPHPHSLAGVGPMSGVEHPLASRVQRVWPSERMRGRSL